MNKSSHLTKVICVLFFMTAHLLQGCSSREKLHQQARPLMGTIVEITVCHTDEQQARFILQEAFEEMARIEDMMSLYKEASEISKVNAQAYDKSVKLSEELFGLIQESIKYSQTTNGAFDVTVGPLMRLWPFYRNEIALPSEQKIFEALQSVGADKLILDPKTKTARFKRPHMALDLGGIAKGYAVDRAIQVIKAEGVKCALVNAGGDLYALGRKPDGRKWRMGVQHPRRPNDLICAFDIEDTAVATSGDYERFFIKNGKRYCHILDPHTGLPAAESVSVTIQAGNATQADTLATGVFVLGPGKGLELIESLSGVEGAIVSKDAGGKAQVSVSSGFRQLFKVDQQNIELSH